MATRAAQNQAECLPFYVPPPQPRMQCVPFCITDGEGQDWALPLVFSVHLEEVVRMGVHPMHPEEVQTY